MRYKTIYLQCFSFDCELFKIFARSKKIGSSPAYRASGAARRYAVLRLVAVRYTRGARKRRIAEVDAVHGCRATRATRLERREDDRMPDRDAYPEDASGE